MKTKDIKPGVVYGYRRGKYGSVEPVVFVVAPSADHLYARDRWAGEGKPVHQHWPNAGKPRAGRGFADPDVGYPVAFGRSEGTDLAALATTSLGQFTAATKASDEELDLRWGVITNPAHVLGPYEDVVAQTKADEDERRRGYEIERQQREEVQQRADRLMATLGKFGIDAKQDDWTEPANLKMTLDEVEKLLSRLQAKPETSEE
ncbi:hypothetical protein ACGFNU_20950 [Spirillospora sp. NPDC048911]|uniref:hypothetical protein n=1 Tax=Spirillospora sp. NPDC048911 TaxID=3364527 RepID=UPI00371DFA38